MDRTLLYSSLLIGVAICTPFIESSSDQQRHVITRIDSVTQRSGCETQCLEQAGCEAIAYDHQISRCVLLGGVTGKTCPSPKTIFELGAFSAPVSLTEPTSTTPVLTALTNVASSVLAGILYLEDDQVLVYSGVTPTLPAGAQHTQNLSVNAMPNCTIYVVLTNSTTLIRPHRPKKPTYHDTVSGVESAWGNCVSVA